MAQQSVEAVRAFWDSAPLFSGESRHEEGTRPFFDEHRRVVIQDCLGGRMDPRILPAPSHRDGVLDLGCGAGFWTAELGQLGCTDLVAADLADAALDLTKKRCAMFGVKAEFSRQNAEHLKFEAERFSHVNCQGVIHHTPRTEACVAEIARVLKPDGTASISVYYRNLLLRGWPLLNVVGRAMARLGIGLKGRGREQILAVESVDDVVRMYDGAANPIGKAYSHKTFVEMLQPWFEVQETFLHFFPMRILPIPVPAGVHRLADRHLGFMIYARLKKRPGIRMQETSRCA